MSQQQIKTLRRDMVDIKMTKIALLEKKITKCEMKNKLKRLIAD